MAAMRERLEPAMAAHITTRSKPAIPSFASASSSAQLAARRSRHAKANAPAFARILAARRSRGHDHARGARARFPVTRKSDLLEIAESGAAVRRARGDALGAGIDGPARVFASPGPIYEPEGRRPDYWRIARALFAAGFRKGDLVHNCFAYHFTPAGSMLETGAHALGCTVFPGGTGQTEQQVQAIADLAPDGYVGTPSFLKIIVEKADEMGVKITSLAKALVSAEPFPPSLRDALLARGIAGYQVYAIGGPRQHRLRDRSARGARRRRGRAGRDRAARHRRSGRARGGRRGRRHDALRTPTIR